MFLGKIDSNVKAALFCYFKTYNQISFNSTPRKTFSNNPPFTYRHNYIRTLHL